MLMSALSALKAWAKQLKQQVLVVYYAARDPRTPLSVRVVALSVAAYALSPIDLIPDFIPILGYLDDLILVPLGIALVIRLLPEAVLTYAQEQAKNDANRPMSRTAAIAIVGIWLFILVLLGWWTFLAMQN